ncbi:MAG: hypothetical protein R3F29_01595 [Planctomycetota bacterium]
MKTITLAALALTTTSPLYAQDLQAALIAIDPIVAAWTNPPPFTEGAVVTHPAGVLTDAWVAAPTGSQWALFTCELTSDGDAIEFYALSALWPPPYAEVRTSADLLLAVWLPDDRAVDVIVRARHLGDTPQTSGFTIDVDADGTIEADTNLNHATRALLTTFTPDQPVRVLRIRDLNTMGQPPQAYDVTVRLEPWHPAGSVAAAACPTTGVVQQVFGPELVSDYHLALLPSDAPGEAAALVAHGVGPFGLFFVAAQPTLVPLALPAPFPGVCDALADAAVFAPGVAVGTAPSGVVDTDWRLGMPQLPPGLVFYVQHASAAAAWPFSFGTTNVVRIDT